MRASFLMLAAADLILLGITAVLGLQVTPEAGYERHFLLGLLSALYSCFVHVVAYMYFVVCDKIVQQAVAAGQLSATHIAQARRLKGRAILTSMAGLVMILLTATLGGAIAMRVNPRWHLVAAFATIFITMAVFIYQYTLIDQSRRDFESAFGEASGDEGGTVKRPRE